MLTVISPAKNLDLSSALPATKTTQPALLDDAERLIEQLRQLGPHEVSRLMHISDKLGQLNYDRYQSWQRPFNCSNARPAILTFNGDVYQGLDAGTFDAQDFAFAQDHLRILSGLYGLLRPLDLIQPYRLEMGTRFANPRGRDLYAFWGDAITTQLNALATKVGAEHLVNLASNEYFRSVRASQLAVPIIEPVFKDWKNGQCKVISFYAKKARGLMSAYIVKNKITSAQHLKEFDHAGYQYNKAMSNASKWVFTRQEQ